MTFPAKPQGDPINPTQDEPHRAGKGAGVALGTPWMQLGTVGAVGSDGISWEYWDWVGSAGAVEVVGSGGSSGIGWEQWDQLGAAGSPFPVPMPMAAPPLGRAQFVGAAGVDGDGPIHAAGKALPEQQLRDVPVLENGRGPGVSRPPQDPRPCPCWGGPGTAPSMSPELPVLPETPR